MFIFSRLNTYSLMLALIASFNSALAFEVLAPEDQEVLKPLLPTTYFVSQEDRVNCTGSYNGRSYSDPAKTHALKNPRGEIIAYVCPRFAAMLAMEGSGILGADNGGISLNWAGNYRYNVVEKCRFGEGVRHGLCLLPFHTLAADNKHHKIGDIIYIPAVAELKLELPDGSIHNGIFEVRDTGGAFIGVGPRRVDMFVGTQNDQNNVFAKAKIHKPNTFNAFKLHGETKTQAVEYLKQKFPELY